MTGHVPTRKAQVLRSSQGPARGASEPGARVQRKRPSVAVTVFLRRPARPGCQGSQAEPGFCRLREPTEQGQDPARGACAFPHLPVGSQASTKQRDGAGLRPEAARPGGGFSIHPAAIASGRSLPGAPSVRPGRGPAAWAVHMGRLRLACATGPRRPGVASKASAGSSDATSSAAVTVPPLRPPDHRVPFSNGNAAGPFPPWTDARDTASVE